jgi:hypothetical protein
MCEVAGDPGVQFLKFESKDDVHVRWRRLQLSQGVALDAHLTRRRRHVRHPVTERSPRRRFRFDIAVVVVADGEPAIAIIDVEVFQGQVQMTMLRVMLEETSRLRLD